MGLDLCLSYLFITLSDAIFANDAGVARPVRRQTGGDLTLFAEDTQEDFVRCRSGI